MRAGHSLILLVAGLALVQCSIAAEQPSDANDSPKAGIQGTQERPSLDKDFYNDAGWNRFETKAEGPVPDSKATWPTLEQEREEAMNIHGWYDPRVSRGWEPKHADVGEKKQATEADKKEATPLDQQFYEEGEYFKYEHKAEKPSTDSNLEALKASAALPSLEEQREEHYNKQGWYDPRYSRRWEAIKSMKYGKRPSAAVQVGEKKVSA